MTKTELEAELEEAKQELAEEIDARKETESDLKLMEGIQHERDKAIDKIEELEEEIVKIRRNEEYEKYYQIFHEH